MPQYLYLDDEGHEAEVEHRMLYSTGIVCGCGLDMWRKPQLTAVNWGGIRPSQGEYSYSVKNHLDNLDESRAKFVEEHEKHERRTV